MPIKTLSAGDDAQVPLSSIKQLLKVEHDNDDVVLTKLIYDAVTAWEDETGQRIILSQQLWTQSCFPRGRGKAAAMEIPGIPLTNLVSVKYWNEENVLTEIPDDQYGFRVYDNQNGIVFPLGSCWPTDLSKDYPDPVEITYDVGVEGGYPSALVAVYYHVKMAYDDLSPADMKAYQSGWDRYTTLYRVGGYY